MMFNVWVLDNRWLCYGLLVEWLTRGHAAALTHSSLQTGGRAVFVCLLEITSLMLTGLSMWNIDSNGFSLHILRRVKMILSGSLWCYLHVDLVWTAADQHWSWCFAGGKEKTCPPRRCLKCWAAWTSCWTSVCTGSLSQVPWVSGCV